MSRLPVVALVNPPSARPVLRDYYCSTRPKAPYLWQPIDLLALAAALTGRAEVHLLDAVGGRVGRAAATRHVEALAPDAVFALASSLTREADLAWLHGIARPGRRLVVGGEVALDPAFDFDRWPSVDGLCLDFTDPGPVDLLLGEAAHGRVRTRGVAPSTQHIGDTYRLGAMPHDALTGRYRLLPWAGPFRSLLTDFGCPFACTFCNSGRHAIGARRRDLEDVAADIDRLARRVYLRDMTFGGYRDHALAVLDLLAPHRLSIRGFLRADLVDGEFAAALAGAGFSMAQIGVEAADEGQRRAMGKRLRDTPVVDGFARLREAGVAAGAHFVVGLQGEPEDAVRRCADTARRLGAAYVSINVYERRHGCAHQEPVHAARRAALGREARRAMLSFNARALARRALPTWRSAPAPRRWW